MSPVCELADVSCFKNSTRDKMMKMQQTKVLQFPPIAVERQEKDTTGHCWVKIQAQNCHEPRKKHHKWEMKAPVAQRLFKDATPRPSVRCKNWQNRRRKLK
jgi:hypothetical protein